MVDHEKTMPNSYLSGKRVDLDIMIIFEGDYD